MLRLSAGKTAEWHRNFAVITAAAALLVCGWSAVAFLQFRICTTDFLVYQCAAHLVAHGQATAVYSADKLVALMHSVCPTLPPDFGRPFDYPPHALLFFSALGLLNYWQAAAVWAGLLICCILAAVWILQRTYVMDESVKPWFYTAILIAGPTIWSLTLGQTTAVLLLALCTAIWALKRNNDALAGAALAVLLIKPHEAVPIMLHFIGARRYRPLVWTVVTAIVLTGIAMLIFGPAIYAGFFHCIYVYFLTPKVADIDTRIGPTLKGVLLTLFGNTTPVSVITLAAVCTTYGFIYWSGRRAGKSKLWLEAGMFGSLPLAFAFAPHFLDYDFMLLAPGVAALVSQPLIHRMTPSLKAVAVAATALLIAPVFLPLHIWLYHTGIMNPSFFLLLAYGAAAQWFIRSNPSLFTEQDAGQDKGSSLQD